MTVEIRDGWLFGSLPDDKGNEWPIVRHKQESFRGPLAFGAPNLILHTTETAGYVEQLRFPSQWQCGEGMIGQHIQLGWAGDSVNDWDRWAQQIEMVAFSQLPLWLPAEGTLGPTVALTAWLHREGLIKTGIKRPTDAWPMVLDRGPQAVSTYYRRLAGLWPGTPGVYGHVDIPDNSHWDPGSFNYPVFFKRVQAVIEGDDMTDAEREKLERALALAKEAAAGLRGVEDYLTETAPPEGAEVIRKRVYRALNEASRRPVAVVHTHPELAPESHSHEGDIDHVHPKHVHGEDVPVEPTP
jgi:hypothetical protein